MPMKIKQTDGSEVEVFTQAETEERVKSEREKALEEYKASNPDKTAEVNDLTTKLADANRKLQEAEAAGGNPEQVKRLREARDAAEKERDGAVAKLTKDLNDFKNETVKEVKDELMAKLTKGDKELEKKIEFEFDNYRTNENSKQAIRERMEKAYQLATGNRPIPTAFDSVSGAGGSRGDYAPTQAGELSQNAKNIGKALGISEEQRKKAADFLKEHKEKQSNNAVFN